MFAPSPVTLFQRYGAAIAAVKHTQRVLPHGAANLPGGPSDKHQRLLALWDAYKTVKSEDMRERTVACSQLAREHGVGNCGEQASVAYVFLTGNLTHAIRPISYSLIPESDEGNHSFVVLGPCSKGGNETLLNWGPQTVICDPWLCQAATRTVKPSKLPMVPLYDQAGAYTPSLFGNALKEMFPGWSKIKILHTDV